MLSRDSSRHISGVIAGNKQRQGPHRPRHSGFRAKDHHASQTSSAGRGRAGCFVSRPRPPGRPMRRRILSAANIQTGFDILNDTSASAAERRQRFATFLLGLTDVRRVALFLLGTYAAKAHRRPISMPMSRPIGLYRLSVYQSYFALYAGQSLRVMSSRERAPGDFVVSTRSRRQWRCADGDRFPCTHRWRKPLLLDLGVARRVAGAGAARSVPRRAGAK